MSSKTIATLVVLGVLGIGAALGIGLAANAISGDSIGLSAEPLRAGETLAPPTGTDEETSTSRTTTGRTTTPTTTTPATTTDPGDDNSGSGGSGQGRGRGRGRGRGGDDD